MLEETSNEKERGFVVKYIKFRIQLELRTENREKPVLCDL